MGVIVGVVIVLLPVFPPINSHLYNVFAVEGPGGEVGFTGKAWNSYMVPSTALSLVGLPLAFFIGGVAISLMVRSYSGLNGAVSAGILVAIGLVWLLATFLPGFLGPIYNPGEVYTRSENLQMLMNYAVAFCGMSSFVVLVGYLGGRLGDRFLPATRC